MSIHQKDKASRANRTDWNRSDGRISIYKATGTVDRTGHTKIDKCDCKSTYDCKDCGTFRERRETCIGRTWTDTNDHNSEPWSKELGMGFDPSETKVDQTVA